MAVHKQPVVVSYLSSLSHALFLHHCNDGNIKVFSFPMILAGMSKEGKYNEKISVNVGCHNQLSGYLCYLRITTPFVTLTFQVTWNVCLMRRDFASNGFSKFDLAVYRLTLTYMNQIPSTKLLPDVHPHVFVAVY